MQNLIIRRAKPEEVKTVVDLNQDLFNIDGPEDNYLNRNWPQEEGEAYFSKKITEPNRICLVAEIDGKIVGYLAGAILKVESWRPVKRTELENMFVKEEFRNKGVGAELVREFLKWSKKKGVKASLVIAYATNERAISFYKKMGFMPESVSLEAKV